MSQLSKVLPPVMAVSAVFMGLNFVVGSPLELGISAQEAQRRLRLLNALNVFGGGLVGGLVAQNYLRKGK